jgi:hypothetical protein
MGGAVTHERLGTVNGRQSFAELEGGGFVVQHIAVDHPDFPNGVALLGPADGEVAGLAQFYFDSRGVRRVYETSLEDGVWRLSRDDPDPFPQRFAAELSDDGRRMDARWERGGEGPDFELDFEMVYERVA